MLRQTSGPGIQGMVGSRTKDTQDQALREAHPSLFYLLDASPLFAFSESGLTTICKRFGVSRDTLEQCISVYLRPGESPNRDEHMAQDVVRLLTATPDLLDTIAKAVKPTARPRKKKTRKEQKGGQRRGE